MIEAELPDGTILEFPEGTDQAVIQGAVKKYLSTANQPEQQKTETLTLNDLDTAFQKIPGIPTLSEFAAGTNRTVAGFLDFLGPDNLNAVLELGGSSKRVPTFSSGMVESGTFSDDLTGKIASSAGEILPLAAGVGQTLRTLAKNLPNLAAGETATTGALRQLGSTTAAGDAGAAVLSGAGMEVGREVGGEDGAMIGQVLAPIAAPFGAQALKVTAKRAFAGGEAGLKNLKSALDDFAEIGTTPTVGTATENKLRRGLENLSSKVLGGDSIKRSFDRSESAMQARLKEIADKLSTVSGDVEAGGVIQRGIKGEGGFVDRFINRSGLLWKGFDDLIDDEALVVATNTTKALDEMVSSSKVGEVLNNPLVSKIKTALDESNGSIDYRTFRQLRSSIGERLGSKDLVSDIPKAQLKRVYGALSEDLRKVASNSGSEAEKSLTRANKYTAAGHKRIDDFVSRISNKVDLDKVFNAATKGGEGIQSINAIKRSLKPEEWEAVVSNVVRKLGRASSGQQDDIGEVFSLNKLLTDWDKLGKAKKVIFSGSPNLDKYRNSLDKIARAANRYKEGIKDFGNPSGTGQFLTNVGVVSGGASALATGNLSAFGVLLGGVAANSATARLMSSPVFVSWLAKSVKAPNLSGPIAALSSVAKLTGEFEPLQELIDTLREGSQQSEQK